MRGFVVGSLALIALYVGLQARGIKAVETGGGAVVSGLRRALSPDVAGIPQRKRNGGGEAK